MVKGREETFEEMVVFIKLFLIIHFFPCRKENVTSEKSTKCEQKRKIFLINSFMSFFNNNIANPNLLHFLTAHISQGPIKILKQGKHALKLFPPALYPPVL